MNLPETFTSRIESTFGAVGKDWLAALPTILEEVTHKWSLRLHPPFEEMAYNYVAPATRSDGVEVVLKIGVPNRELETEMEALQIYGGEGAVELLEVEPELGAMLLERLSPGKAIFHLDDEAATDEAIIVMGQLHGKSPPDGKFPTVADWAKGLERLRSTFGGGTGPFPPRIIEQVEAISKDLLRSMDQPVLLHGDLHHWNILSAQRSSWLAIDPKGVVGEPAYETGAWFRNPYPQLLTWPNAKQVIARRITQFSAALDVDRDRIRGWSLYQAVLSAWWSFEDSGQGWEYGIAVAELMD